MARRTSGQHVPAVLPTQPPYALSPTNFRFPGLAALAGRAPLGGQREVAMAAYVAARLAHDLLPDRELEQPVRAERAAAARNWLATLSLPPQVRAPMVRLVDATCADRAGTAAAVRAVMTVTAQMLDRSARSELDQLAVSLERH